MTSNSSNIYMNLLDFKNIMEKKIMKIIMILKN